MSGKRIGAFKSPNEMQKFISYDSNDTTLLNDVGALYGIYFGDPREPYTAEQNAVIMLSIILRCKPDISGDILRRICRESKLGDLVKWKKCIAGRRTIDLIVSAAETYTNDHSAEPLNYDTAVRTYDALINSLEAAANADRKPRLNIEILEWLFEDRSFTVFHDSISHKIIFQDEDGHDCELDRIVAELHSDIGSTYSNVSFEVLHQYIRFIAYKNERNTVTEWLKSLQYDNNDHLSDLYSLLRIKDNDSLSKVLLHKWLLQCVAMAHNNDNHMIGAEGCLVFQGGQGIGKTSAIEFLGMKQMNRDWVKTGREINEDDKDTYRRVMTCWICELGELENTIRKSSREFMKLFITSDFDEYRLPYRRDDERFPRRTSLAATCNDDGYLVDPTGNRRFFTIPIDEEIPYYELQEFDFPALWAQIYHEYIQYPTQNDRDACFRLSADEKKWLSERNSGFTKSIRAEDEIRDIFAMAKTSPNEYELRTMTISEWKQLYPQIKNQSSECIGKVLKKCGSEFGIVDVRTRKSRQYEGLPVKRLSFYLPAEPVTQQQDKPAQASAVNDGISSAEREQLMKWLDI